MSEGLNYLPEEYTHEEGDVTYNNSETETQEIQNELRAAGEQSEEDKEFKLTPETEAKIMEKVIDVLTDEYYLHSTGEQSIQGVLANGLISPNFYERLNERNVKLEFPTSKKLDGREQPINNRKGNANVIYFHKNEIIQRNITDPKYQKNWCDTGSQYGDIGILIDKDIKNLSRAVVRHSPEQFAQAISEGKTAEKAREIMNNMEPTDLRGINERISPKFFIGLIISPEKMTPEIEQSSILRGLPIYDRQGGLIWPRQMSYEEVRQFAAERDNKEAEQSDE